MSDEKLQETLRRFRSTFRAWFVAVTDQDMCAILAAPRATLLSVLGERYGYSSAEAKAAWNEFVLRHVDGHDLKPSRSADGSNGPFHRRQAVGRASHNWAMCQLRFNQPQSPYSQRPWLPKLPKL